MFLHHLVPNREWISKRWCYFASPEAPSYEPEAVPKPSEAKTAEELSRLARGVEGVRPAVEVRAEISPEQREAIGKKAVEREGKNTQEILKLKGINPTEAMIKKGLIENPPAVAYVEKTEHSDLQGSLQSVRGNTLNRIQEVVKLAA